MLYQLSNVLILINQSTNQSITNISPLISLLFHCQENFMLSVIHKYQKVFFFYICLETLSFFFNCCCPFGFSCECFIPSYYFQLHCALVCPVSPVLLLLYISLFILATSNYCICPPPPQPVTSFSRFTSIHFLLLQFCSLFRCLYYSD